MTTPSPETVRHVRLPPERFYWAVLEPPRSRRALWPRRSQRESELGYRFEAVLPVPLEQVHAVFVPRAGSRFLACGLGRDEILRSLQDGAVTLAPEGVPAHLQAEEVGAGINLLTGAMEPAAVRRARRRWAAQAVLVLVCCTAAMVYGLERRTADERRAGQAIDQAAREVYAQVLPARAPNAQPPSVRLTAELRTLRQTHAAPPALSAPDAAQTLRRILALWPAGVTARTESLVVSPTSVTLTASVPDHDQAQAVASALGHAEGWRSEQPQVSQARDMVRLTARLKRAEKEQP